LNAIIGVTEMLRENAEALKQDVEPLDRVLAAGRHLPCQAPGKGNPVTRIACI